MTETAPLFIKRQMFEEDKIQQSNYMYLDLDKVLHCLQWLIRKNCWGMPVFSGFYLNRLLKC